MIILLDKEKIIKDVTAGIRACAKQANDIGTWTYYLARNINYNGKEVDVALVYTYEKGYNELIKQPDDGILIKIAHQPSNSAMQCDYDIDWEFPDCANNYTEEIIPVDFILHNIVLDKDQIDYHIGDAIKYCLEWCAEYGI